MKYWRDGMSLLLYGLGFLLLLEWIWPIKTLSETANIWVFLLFLLLCFLLFFLRAPIYVSFLFKGGAILFFLHFLYFEGSFLLVDWFFLFIEDLKLNIDYVFHGNLQALTHLFRSLVFFIILWMMMYLLEYWLIRRKQVLLFFFMTIVYVAFLDTFTPYDASGSMVRIVLIGFIIIGILTFQRHLKKEKLKKETIIFRKWMLFLSMMILFSSFFGYILPKAQPIWPDPVPYLKVFNGMGTMKKVGYSEDDTQLGGSITGDYTVVFQTIVESPHYWKVETKDVYTGKGWIQSEDKLKNIRFFGNRQIPITSFVEGVNYEQSIHETSTVHQLKEYPHLLYPLGVTRIQSDRGYSFELDPSIEKIYSYKGHETASLEEYSLTYEIPVYTEDMLRKSDSGHSSLLSVSFMQRYTQLPDHLPSRVKELAVEITKGRTNNYDKAKAVEQYFKTAQYSYSLNDVAIPNKDKDYVDQFLFETMKGYCDNFSTSMVVLLRSLDIPSRWVKGYTEGRFTGMEGNLYKYEITNNNAHSWVEVYFPQIGWVPFEPTPGFTNEAAANIEEDEKQEGTEASVQSEEVETNEQDEEVKKEEKERKSHRENVEGLFAHSWVWLVLLGLVLLLLVFYTYRTRSKWLSFYYIRKLKYVEKDDAFLAAYEVLLKQLNRVGMTRGTGQTLREYAKRVDEHYSTTEMTLLTKQYEEYLYGNQVKKGTWLEVRELWENLIKKTMA